MSKILINLVIEGPDNSKVMQVAEYIYNIKIPVEINDPNNKDYVNVHRIKDDIGEK